MDQKLSSEHAALTSQTKRSAFALPFLYLAYSERDSECTYRDIAAAVAWPMVLPIAGRDQHLGSHIPPDDQTKTTVISCCSRADGREGMSLSLSTRERPLSPSPLLPMRSTAAVKRRITKREGGTSHNTERTTEGAKEQREREKCHSGGENGRDTWRPRAPKNKKEANDR